MKTLKELIDIELAAIPEGKYKCIDEFITNDQRSAGFISSMTNEFTFDTPEETSPLYTVSQTRARHSAISYLLGLVFKNFGNLYNSIGGIVDDRSDDYGNRLWLMTALNHDLAYTSTYLMDEKLDLRKKYAPYLLNNIYDEEYLEPLNGFYSKREKNIWLLVAPS